MTWDWLIFGVRYHLWSSCLVTMKCSWVLSDLGQWVRWRSYRRLWAGRPHAWISSTRPIDHGQQSSWAFIVYLCHMPKQRMTQNKHLSKSYLGVSLVKYSLKALNKRTFYGRIRYFKENILLKNFIWSIQSYNF